RADRLSESIRPLDQPPYVGAMQIIQRTLNETRSSGPQPLHPSVVCGRYLGPVAFEKPLPEEEVKFLTALLAREHSESEKMQMIQAASLAFHQGALDPGVVSLWKIYWKYLSLFSVFSTRPLPSFDLLQFQIRSKIIEEVFASTGVRPDLTEISNRTRAGLSWLSQQLNLGGARGI
ncbi:MAG: hypothetical protein ACO3A2_11270, partial [Bdellovibrionia bacterium]